MGRRGRSRSASEASDSDRSRSRRDAKKARRDKEEEGEGEDSRSRKRSGSSKSSSKKESRKKDRKRSKSSKGERKHGSSRESKKNKKHSDSHRKRRRSRSASDSDGSSSDASSSSSRASSPARASSSSQSRSLVPLLSAASVTRCLELVDTLLTHGGGDREQSLQEVQFMLFKLDAGSSVDVSGLDDQLVRHILNTMLRELGCKVRRDPSTNETGWMAPLDARTGKAAYKLLDVMAEAFKPKQTETAAAPAAAAVPIGPAGPPSAAIGPTMPPPAAASAAAAAASSADSTAVAAPRMLGPALPSARDFDLLASSAGEPESQPDAADDDAHNFGPKMPSQMTPQELQAFDRLRASREHLASVKQMEAAGGRQTDGREEWMTALPTGESGMPSTAALAALAATGDRESMRARGFASKAVTKVDQDMEWAMSPAEKARKDAERVAVRQAEQAVYNSSRAINGDLSDFAGGQGRTSANASAAAAQAANDRMMARYKQQQVATADSLMAAHARAAEEAAKTAKAEAGGLFRWDREKEMGMRAVKGAAALKKEISSAFTLNDNFAPASS